jgi:hypothetical protein
MYETNFLQHKRDFFDAGQSNLYKQFFSIEFCVLIYFSDEILHTVAASSDQYDAWNEHKNHAHARNSQKFHALK